MYREYSLYSESAMEDKLADISFRKRIIEEITGSENQDRLQNSQEEWDVYTGNIEPYVRQSLLDRLDKCTVDQMPIVSAVNILSKVIDSRSSLYRNEPAREFSDLSDNQKETVDRIYDDMGADFKFLESNRLYELQKKQTHILIEPKRGKLTMRPVKAHQLNPIPNKHDSETADIFIFSGYNSELNTNKTLVPGQDNTDQAIADYDDAKKEACRYIVWSKSFHFVMDGKGAIVSEDTASPLAAYGVVPVVEISAMKDFTYWRELTNDVAKFCVDYNCSLSSLAMVVEMQGFAQAYFKAPKEIMPTHMEIGPTKVLRIGYESGSEDDIEFGFAQPGSDIAGSQAFVESLLAQFLSSQGVDPTTVSGSASAEKFNSGIERLLAQIEKFEASKDTMALFRQAESDVYKVVKAWHNALKNTDALDKRYVTTELPANSEVTVKYAEPQSVMSEAETLDLLERKRDLGIYDDVDIVAEARGVSRDEAKDVIKEREVL